MPGRVTIGVLGCGYWGSKHVRVLAGLPDVQVIAVDSDTNRLSSLQSTFGSGLGTATSIGSVVRSLDGAVVATPPETHHPIASRLLRAGLPTLVEKPLAMTTDDARDLIDRAEAVHAPLMVGHTFLYNRAVQMLRQIITTGQLGRVFHFDSARLNLGLYQQHVDVIWDLAPHDLSILNWVLGRDPVSVRAWGGQYASRHHHDVAYLQLDYGDVRAQLHVSWLEPRKVRRMTVVGSERMVVYNDLADEERLRVYDKGVLEPEVDRWHLVPASYRNGGIVSPFVEFEEPLQLEDADFVECVRTGKQPHSSAESGLAVVTVLEAASRALRSGGAEPCATDRPSTAHTPGMVVA